MAQWVKNPPAMQEDYNAMQEDCNAMQGSSVGLIHELRRSLGGGNENSHQYSCLENPMDRGSWRDTVCSPIGHKELEALESILGGLKTGSPSY